MDYSLIRARARENLRDNWGLSIAVSLIALLVGALHTSVRANLNINLPYHDLHPLLVSFFAAIGSIAGMLSFAQFILGGTIQLGYSRYLLDQHDKRELRFETLFSQFDRFSQGFLQMFLRTLFILLWSLLLVIPGMVKSLSYAMTPFLMADHPDMKARDAIKASMELMDGHKFDLFVLNLTFLGWALANIFTLGIGSLWLNPYINAAHAAFYRQIQAEAKYTTVEF